MRFENYSKTKSDKKYTLQIEQGGTGVRTEEDAHRVLESLDKNKINKPNGYLGLNERGLVDPEHLPANIGGVNTVTLKGPQEVALGSSIIVEITNFDSFTNYQINTNKVTVTREDEMLLVTGASYGDDGYFEINGSRFPIRVTLSFSPLTGTFNHTATKDVTTTTVAGKRDFSLVALGKPTKSHMGSSNAGEVEILNASDVSGFNTLETFNPSVLNSRIAYTGQGTKKFTFNNQTVTKTDEGYIDVNGSGNVIIDCTGDVIQIPGTPEEGNPDYPNGLPSFIPSSSELRRGTYYRKIIIHLYKNSEPPQQGGNSFQFAITEKYTINTVPTDIETRLKLNTHYTCTRTIEEYFKQSSEPFPSAPVIQGPTGTNEIYLSAAGRWVSTITIRFSSIPSGFYIFGSTNNGMVVDSSGQSIEKDLNQPGSGNNLVYGTRAVGQEAYPDGLPPYKPAVPASETTSSITVIGDNFTFSGTTIKQTVYPFKNLYLGGSISVSGSIVVVGSSRTSAEGFNDGGRIYILTRQTTGWSRELFTVPAETPYPEFGKEVKAFNSGNHVLVGAPKANKIYLYTNGTNTFSLQSTITPPSIPTGSNFGTSIDVAKNETTIAVSAPQQSTYGAIYLYTRNNNSLTLSETISVTLPSGFRLGHKVRVISDTKLFTTIRNNAVENNAVIVLSKVNGTWVIEKTFNNPAGEVNQNFASDFEVDVNGNIIYINSPGNETTKGMIYGYVFTNNQWLGLESISNPTGSLSDGFSSSFETNENGNACIVLSKIYSDVKLHYLT